MWQAAAIDLPRERKFIPTLILVMHQAAIPTTVDGVGLPTQVRFTDALYPPAEAAMRMQGQAPVSLTQTRGPALCSRSPTVI